MYSTSNATPCDSGVNSISDRGAVVNANVGAKAVKPLQSSGPELLNKNGPLCAEEVIVTHPLTGCVLMNDSIREACRIYNERMSTIEVSLPPEPEFTEFGKILTHFEEETDPRFYTEEEIETKRAELVARMCEYHCHEGVVGQITPAAVTEKKIVDKKTGKEKTLIRKWDWGCAGHDHKNPKYPCDKVHVGDIFVENVTSKNTQTESPATVAGDKGMSVIGAGGGPVMPNADQTARTTTSEPIRIVEEKIVSGTASNESTGLCLGSNAGAGGVSVERGQHESVLGSCTRKQARLLAFISENRHDDSKKDQVNEAICDLEESGQFDEYSGEDEEENEDEVKQEQKNRAIIAEEKFKIFRVFEQRSVFWDALVKDIEGRMKPIVGRMRHLMNTLDGVLRQLKRLSSFGEKKFKQSLDEIAGYWKQFQDITSEMKSVQADYDDLNSRLEKYYKNYQDSSNQELQYVHEIEELVPGRIDGDPERGILPHVMEDRKMWMLADKFDVLNETIASFLGRKMTAEEKDDLLHSQKILVEHLKKFDCYVGYKFV